MAKMINTHNLIVDFGKHKGERWTRIPIGYLKWLVNEDSQYKEMAESELKRRGVVIEHIIEISGHAIDRASTSCHKIWEQTSLKNEGIYSWLQRIASEAIKPFYKVGEKRFERKGIIYNRMRFIFHFGEMYPVLLTIIPIKKRK
jgi:hypothetical protein